MQRWKRLKLFSLFDAQRSRCVDFSCLSTLHRFLRNSFGAHCYWRLTSQHIEELIGSGVCMTWLDIRQRNRNAFASYIQVIVQLAGSASNISVGVLRSRKNAKPNCFDVKSKKRASCAWYSSSTRHYSYDQSIFPNNVATHRRLQQWAHKTGENIMKEIKKNQP